MFSLLYEKGISVSTESFEISICIRSLLLKLDFFLEKNLAKMMMSLYGSSIASYK